MKLTPYEYGILGRLVHGKLVEAHEKTKSKHIFLWPYKDAPIGRWELVPRATLDRLRKFRLVSSKGSVWHYIIDTQITIYTITKAGLDYDQR